MYIIYIYIYPWHYTGVCVCVRDISSGFEHLEDDKWHFCVVIFYYGEGAVCIKILAIRWHRVLDWIWRVSVPAPRVLRHWGSTSYSTGLRTTSRWSSAAPLHGGPRATPQLLAIGPARRRDSKGSPSPFEQDTVMFWTQTLIYTL